MGKLFAVGSLFVDVATTAGAFAADSQASWITWIVLNVALLFLPVAYAVCELLLAAVTNAPQVLNEGRGD